MRSVSKRQIDISFEFSRKKDGTLMQWLPLYQFSAWLSFSFLVVVLLYKSSAQVSLFLSASVLLIKKHILISPISIYINSILIFFLHNRSQFSIHATTTINLLNELFITENIRQEYSRTKTFIRLADTADRQVSAFLRNDAPRKNLFHYLARLSCINA